ncbi:MAG: hypothetical protein ACLQUY_16060 [Ktedonobacterales bacterium]
MGDDYSCRYMFMFPKIGPNTIDALFAGKDENVRAAYAHLTQVLRRIGPFEEEPRSFYSGHG